MMNIYQEEGYKDRMDYLKGLADDYGVPLDVVVAAADILGPNEDLDGLVTALGDYADGNSRFL